MGTEGDGSAVYEAHITKRDGTTPPAGIVIYS
jgi:hypothetical protein